MVYVKIDENKFSTEKTTTQIYSYTYLLRQKQVLEKQLLDVNTLISEAEKLGITNQLEE